MKTHHWIKFFFSAAGTILLFAAIERFLIASGNSPILSLPDPALGISLRYSILITGLIEFAVATVCLSNRSAYFKAGWLAWCITNYFIFKINVLRMYCSPQATCIGNLTDPLQISRGYYGRVTTLLPLLLAAGSYAALASFWIIRRKRRPDATGQPEFTKMSCVLCNGHIEFPTYALGQKISCPHCVKPITLIGHRL